MKTTPESQNHLAIVVHGEPERSVMGKLNAVLPSMIKHMVSGVTAETFPQDAVELAVMGPQNTCIERMSLSRDCWNVLLTHGSLETLKSDIRQGALLEPSVAGQVELMSNSYEHGSCKTSWNDQWSCGCDDECPHCGTPVAPVTSEPLRSLVLDERGVWNIVFFEDQELSNEASAAPPQSPTGIDILPGADPSDVISFDTTDRPGRRRGPGI